MRPLPTTAATALAAATALVGAGLALAPAATAVTSGTDLAPHTTFTMHVDEATGAVPLPASGEDIPNIDSVKSAIRAYYNATDGIADKTSSAYLTQVRALEADLGAGLPQEAPADTALVFDVDDTLLWNYDFEDHAIHFNFSSNDQWVAEHRFPAVPGMPALLAELHARGYQLFAVTGRPAYQEDDTIANLTEQGFTTSGEPGSGTPLFDAATTYTKWNTGAAGSAHPYDAAAVPDYIRDGDCSTSVSGLPGSFKCTTVEYKAQTRRHIMAGADGVAGTADDLTIARNVGDQLSDLWGGYGTPVKIPNPTYFLASPNLAHPGPDDASATLRLPDTYEMAPRTTPATAASDGDAIPNIDPVRAEIRSYYGANAAGLADRTSSAYVAELATLEETWTKRITADCRRGVDAIVAARARIAAARAAAARAERTVRVQTRRLERAQRALRRAHSHHSTADARRARQAVHAARAARRTALAALTRARRTLATTTVPGRPAAVFDADDTTLMTYDMEDGAMHFVFDPAAQNDDWVQPQRFPATPGMPELVADVADAGCTIVGLTGRSDSQKYATLGNLAKVGYSDFRANRYFTKWNSGTTPPAYVDCALEGDPGTCSTSEYKTSTRRHLEADLGLDVVANLGDQFSDLRGGYAERTYKLPNPTYYLP